MRKKGLPNKAMLVMRGIIGAYLLFLVYQLAKSLSTATGGERAAFIIAIVIFAIAGLGVLALTVYDYARGAYVGGKLDHSSEETETVSEANVTEAETVSEDEETGESKIIH